MRSFWGLNCLLVGLILALVDGSVSHPVRTSKWIKKTEFQDLQNRGVWKVIEKKETFYVPEVPRYTSHELDSQQETTQSDTNSKSQPPVRGGVYKRDTSDESTPSVPESSSEQPRRRWNHHHDHVDSWRATHKTKPYGQVVGHSRVNVNGGYKSENESTSSSLLRLAPGHYISFFSYRISFPFLKFAPMSFPQFPLPSIFTTVMIILALVWIAILTIGLVEVGNYLWRRRYTARLAAESERLANEEASSRECMKEPFQVLVVPRAPWRTESRRNETSELLSSTLDDDSDIEMDDYRMPLP